jgi:hypothetical protein
LFAVNVLDPVPPLLTPKPGLKVTVVLEIVPPVIVTLALATDVLLIAPPVIDTLAKLLVPLPMPFTPFTTVVKLLSNCDNGMAVVTPAKVFGMLIGRGIRTSL